MPKELEQRIAKEFYVDKVTKDDICKRYNIRPKTFQIIIGKFKDQFAGN